jgi:DNA-binding transcriptional regulator YdaS (Cro superfamily)
MVYYSQFKKEIVMTAIDNAIRLAGSANKLACTIGVSGMAVSQWKAKGTVPSSRVLQVFSATGVTPHELRPDLYPNPTDGLPKE